MTLSEYLALVPMWHANRPRFMNTLATLLQPLIDAQDMLTKLTADFDLDTAVGVQLDMVGQWLGRNRYVKIPITGVFFSFDLPEQRIGFDQAVWFGPFDSADGVQRLDDDTYRMILKLQAIANQWDGTTPSIAAELDRVFPGITVNDRGDAIVTVMTMDVLIPDNLISTLMLRVLEQDYPVKPAGVHVNFEQTTVITTPIFAFDAVLYPGGPLGGFDESSWGIIVHTR